MRIAAIIESPITVGGGFNQSISAVLQLQRLCEGRHELVVFTSAPQDIGHLREKGIQSLPLRRGVIDRWVQMCRPSPLLRKLQARLSILGSFEKDLIANGVDLVYFVGHSFKPLSLQRLPHVATVWDLCHLDQPEFPEVSSGAEFFDRELSFAYSLPNAVAVVCASRSLAQKIATHYGVDPARLIVMPFTPSPFLEKAASSKRSAVLDKYGLVPGYYFYPAQFWPHKNHVRILNAMSRAAENGVVRNIVFTGSDHGNLPHLRGEIERLGLSARVSSLGFLPPEDMRGIYENAFAVVMPTYFGPTNIPPLEAWSMRVPLIYSRHLAEQAGDAALLADVDSVEELTAALLQLEDSAVREMLVEAGDNRLHSLAQDRHRAELEFATHLERFAARLLCWRPHSDSAPRSGRNAT